MPQSCISWDSLFLQTIILKSKGKMGEKSLSCGKYTKVENFFYNLNFFCSHVIKFLAHHPRDLHATIDFKVLLIFFGGVGLALFDHGFNQKNIKILYRLTIVLFFLLVILYFSQSCLDSNTILLAHYHISFTQFF